jgi:signal transduction histidine kinase
MSEPDPSITESDGMESPAQVAELLARQARELDALMQVGQALSTETRLRPLLHMVADEARHLTESRLCTILLLSDDDETLERNAVSGQVTSKAWEIQQIPVVGSLTGRVIINREALLVPDVQQEPEYRQIEFAQAENLHGLLAVPILYDQYVIGVISLYTEGPPVEESRVRTLLSAFASQAAVAIQSARRLEHIVETEQLLRHSERMSLLGMMSAELAHEVRNPITVIEMLLHAVHDDPQLPEASRGDLQVALDKLNEIDSIITRTLDLAASPGADGETTSLAPLADEVIELLRHRFDEHGIQIDRDYVHAMPPISAVSGQIRQVLLNLMLNAYEVLKNNSEQEIASEPNIMNALQGESIRQQTPKHRVRIALRETAFNGQDGIEASIIDNGPGFPEDLLQRAFEPFVTGREKGTGLGLYICNKIIAKHLGHMRVQNNESEPGCCISFWLPTHHDPPS